MTRRAVLMACFGKRYRAGAMGPDAFDCFGLVAHLSRELFGIDIPRDRVGMIRARSIYQPATIPNDGALVLMLEGHRHVGLWLAPERGILHAIEGRGVVFDNPNALALTGFGLPKYLARKCRTLPAASDPFPASMP